MPDGDVYILSDEPKGIMYVGVTSDLIRRIDEQQNGPIDGFTKRYGLKQLVWFEQYDDIRTALHVKTMKHWPRAWNARLIDANLFERRL
jgi:putative endonuclease